MTTDDKQLISALRILADDHDIEPVMQSHLIHSADRIQQLMAAVEFVRKFVTCPCCCQAEVCNWDCTYKTDCPDSAERMNEARAALKGGTQ